MGLRLEVVQDANTPAFPPQKITDMRANEAGPAGDQGAFFVRTHDCV
jgi:hypothetical protein